MLSPKKLQQTYFSLPTNFQLRMRRVNHEDDHGVAKHDGVISVVIDAALSRPAYVILLEWANSMSAGFYSIVQNAGAVIGRDMKVWARLSDAANARANSSLLV